MKFLEENNYLDSFETVQRECGITYNNFEIADNISMDNILKDFIEYYEFKYDQQPLIVKESKIDVINKKTKKLP